MNEDIAGRISGEQGMDKILIWGTGMLAEQALRQCDIESRFEIIGFIDNDSRKTGEKFYGKTVYTPDILNRTVPDRIVILTAQQEEIERQIRREFPNISVPIEEKNYFYKQFIMKRYRNSHDPEIVGILDYLGNRDLQVFNYDFVNKYEKMDFDIRFDEACGLYFVYYGDKRLYFARTLDTREAVAEYYRSIMIEQDAESPHRYTDGGFGVKDGDVVIDIGVAEGNFSLQVVDRVSRLYIIEADDGWIEALRQTFRDYRDKVVIIKKFVSSMDAGRYATLDTLIKEPVDFIKMDIEGSEWDALLGAKELIARSEGLRCAVCAYHGDFDEVLIKDVLVKYGMETSVTKGYMWFPETIRQTYVSTRLCRGIVRGIKRS